MASSVASLLDRLPAPIDLDAHLAAVHPLLGLRTRGVVESVRPQTLSSASMVMRVSGSWAPHRPGQFVTVGVDVDGVRHQRCYSITSAPDRRRVEITVQDTGGVVSSYLVRRCRPGTVIHLDGPDGDFTLPEHLSGARLLFVTGGSGITPVMGMLRSLPPDGGGADVVLLHHAPSDDRVMFAAELALRASAPWLTLHVQLTRAAGPASRGSGHLSRSRLDDLCADWRERTAYVCGPGPMLDAATELWRSEGLGANLLTERFTPAAPAAQSSQFGSADSAEPARARVRFDRSGIDVEASTQTPLLAVAEAAGLSPAHGCRMGICRTCSTRLSAGATRDLRDGRTAQPGEHIQICVHAADGHCAVEL